MFMVLNAAFNESDGQPLSYDAMIAQTDGPGEHQGIESHSPLSHASDALCLLEDKRRIVAGCFQELLFLATKGLIDLEQARPYSNIIGNFTAIFEIQSNIPPMLLIFLVFAIAAVSKTDLFETVQLS